jgi:4-amino-4-deoxy-L-arabinose transferase-like glycosyltransferase
MRRGSISLYRTSAPWLLLLAAAALALGWDLGGHRFLDPDEGRNAEVAREMAETDDYVVPHLDGLPYLDKPVVYFAAAALGMEVLGPRETAARLPALLATFATIAVVVWFARRRWGSAAGWLAGVALATMPMVAAYARTTIFDSTLSFFTTSAIICFAVERPVLAWAAIGAGGITKGPVAILIPLATLIPWSLLAGVPVRRLFPWRGLLAFAVVALPWFFAVTARIPEFPHYVFVRETFERVTTRSFHRTAPLWYFLPILPLAAFPWIVPAVSRLSAARIHWSWLARKVNENARDPWLLAAWVLGPLVFFSLNQSKLPQYVLPLMPAFALAAARTLSREGVAAGWKAYIVVAVPLGLALAAVTLWLPSSIPVTPLEQAAIPFTARVLAAALLASAALVALAARRGSVPLAAAGYALVTLALPFASGPLLRAVGDDRSAHTLATVIPERVSVVAVAAYPPSLPFYLRRPILLATAHARELTSNYIADYADHYRTIPGSPLLPAEAWRERLARCAEPTVFVTRAGDRGTREQLAHLPLLFTDGHYAAYGPCAAPAPAVNSAFPIPHSPLGSGEGGS